MTAKEYLQTVYSLSQQIKRLNSRREDIRNDMFSLGGIAYDQERVQTSPTGDRMTVLVARVDEIERDIVKKLDELESEKQKVILKIESVPQENYKQLLYERYVLCKRWERIAADWDKGIRWIYRMHGKALTAFEKTWDGH